ncbi:glycine N-acyltransferase-like protein 3 [Bemisia tabaci]|uniref:glycine N-acyltransferase-like protein 3 n=1 Tax=Bemisia tabaci TaxID=7038 RepID=UPI003B28A3F7
MKNLQDALLTTNRFRWISSETMILFAAVAEKLMPLVENFVSHCKLEIRENDKTIYKWRMPEQLGFGDIRCSPEVRLAPLGLESLEQIRSNWFDIKGATEYLATLIKHNHTMGVYSRSSSELCAWVLFSEFCTLSALHTMEQHRRKGYAKLAIKAICERLLSEGLLIGATVHEHNTASLKLFDSLQFESSRDTFRYVVALPLNQEPCG